MNKFEQIVTTAVMSVMTLLGINVEEHKQTFPNFIEKISKSLPFSEEDRPNQEIEKVTVTETKKEIEKTVVQPNPPKTPPPPPVKKAVPVNIIATNTSIEKKVKSAVGNIFCTIIKNGKVQKITGSAVAISSNGVMLTNAHVAQYLLIDNVGTEESVNCFVRTGSPAKRAYKASVVFLPTEWVESNKHNLNQTVTTGTGENDYALIVLNEKIQNSGASDLSFVEWSVNEPTLNIGIILAGYPAFNGNILDNALYPTIDKSEIKDTWRINHSENDLLGTAPTILAVNGSSGGAVTNVDGRLLGIMVATTLDTYSNKPNMRLISFKYISKDIENKTGKSLDYFIKNADQESLNFIKGEGSRLAQILISNSK